MNNGGLVWIILVHFLQVLPQTYIRTTVLVGPMLQDLLQD